MGAGDGGVGQVQSARGHAVKGHAAGGTSHQQSRGTQVKLHAKPSEGSEDEKAEKD